MFRKVLFTKKENEGKALVLGDVEVRYVNCREAHWDPCIMVPLVKAEMESPPVGYHLYRSIKFSWIEGCNHFVSSVCLFQSSLNPIRPFVVGSLR